MDKQKVHAPPALPPVHACTTCQPRPPPQTCWTSCPRGPTRSSSSATCPRTLTTSTTCRSGTLGVWPVQAHPWCSHCLSLRFVSADQLQSGAISRPTCDTVSRTGWMTARSPPRLPLACSAARCGCWPGFLGTGTWRRLWLALALLGCLESHPVAPFRPNLRYPSLPPPAAGRVCRVRAGLPVRRPSGDVAAARG